MSTIVTSADVERLYGLTKNYLLNFQNSRQCQEAFHMAPELHIIVKRTLEFRRMQKMVGDYAYERRRVSFVALD